MNPIRAGLVGFGGYAAVYRRLVAEAEREGLCRLQALAVPPAQRREAEAAYRGSGTALCESVEELFRAQGSGGIEALLLPLPIDLHADFALRALSGGAHVLLEKPIAGTLQQAEEIQGAAAEAGRQVAVGFQYMYDPGILELKRLALEGEYGRLREIRIKVLWARGEGYYRRTYWAGRLTVNGRPVNDCPLNNAAAHFLQNALFLGGGREETALPRRVYAENVRANAIEGADTQFARITTDTGITITAAASHACPREEDPEMTLVFDGARAVWTPGRIYLAEGSGDGAEAAELPVEGRVSGSELRSLLFRDALRSFGEGRRPRANVGTCIGHAAAVSAVLAPEFPVTAVPEAFLERREGVTGPGYTGGGPDSAVVIAGIEAAAERAYREGIGFREAGEPWATE
jgi:predicted dehydrogenase